MAYDATRNNVVLFGGDLLTPSAVGGTWCWDGQDWTQVSEIGPIGRYGHGLAHDVERGQTVLFGGGQPGNNTLPLADTWEWDGQQWTQTANSGPTARWFPAMAYDMLRQRVVLFGGSIGNLDGSGAGEVVADTWEWDGQQWTMLAETGPSPRTGAAMSFDPGTDTLLLFGGADAAGALLADTWAWNGSDWFQVSEIGPSARRGVAMTSLPDRVVVFGGSVSSAQPPQGAVDDGTWVWQNQRWTQVCDFGPPARSGHAMAFDADSGRIILFGGVSASGADQVDGAALLADTWECIPPPTDTPTATGTMSLTITPTSVERRDLIPVVITGVIQLLPALPTDRFVVVSAPDLAVNAQQVTVPAGATTGNFSILSQTPDLGAHTITAILGSVTAEATLTVT